MSVPQQSGAGGEVGLTKAPAPVPAEPPGASEATRLLCAGTYMDDAFRDAVIDELYVHEERFAAPSPGFDAARVLAHALRARRLQLGWAAAVLLLWIVALPLSGGLATLYVFPVVAMALGRAVRRAPIPGWLARLAGFVLRWYGRLTLFGYLLWLVAAAFGAEVGTGEVTGYGWLTDIWGGGPGTSLGSSEDFGWSGTGSSYAVADESGMVLQAWVALLLPVLVAVAVGMQRGQFARVLDQELSPDRFPDVTADPAERAEGFRFTRLRDRVRTEQHGPLVMYRSDNPFCGAGVPYKAWSLAVELVPREDRTVELLDNSAILARIVPLVKDLRVPSPHGSPDKAAAVRDRLRGLEIDECVFLPARGLRSRAAAPYAQEEVERHRAEAVEEGAEARRHFLRIRVGSWEECVVTTVFVRVHTQGGMLMLEVAPHVLGPLREPFQEADRIAHQYRHHHAFGKAVWALSQTPRAAGRALTTLLRGLWSAWRLAIGGHGAALPDGPAVSVRELASSGYASLFQDMDIARYLDTVQHRVAGGVTTALRDAGYRTEEFEQRVVHVADGGVYVESAQGAVGIGDHNTITNTTQRGTAAKGRGKRGNG